MSASKRRLKNLGIILFLQQSLADIASAEIKMDTNEVKTENSSSVLLTPFHLYITIEEQDVKMWPEISLDQDSDIIHGEKYSASQLKQFKVSQVLVRQAPLARSHSSLKPLAHLKRYIC